MSPALRRDRTPPEPRREAAPAAPFAGHPRATHARRLYEWVSGESAHERAARLREPPPCPTSSIYGRSDGIVAWRCSLNPPAPRTENIEIRASHIGMGPNPLALYAVADRLAQNPRDWKPFAPAPALRRLFGHAR